MLDDQIYSFKRYPFIVLFSTNGIPVHHVKTWLMTRNLVKGSIIVIYVAMATLKISASGMFKLLCHYF